MTLSEVLENFTSEEIADALYRAELPLGGTKAERIARLCEGAQQAEQSPREVLSMFTAESLRDACDCAEVRSGRKVSEMVDALVGLLDGAARGASASASTPPVVRLAPTKENVLSALAEFRVPVRSLRSEAHAHDALADYLRPRFDAVWMEYNVGGMLGVKIDLDIGGGKVGVEVKHVESILSSTAELHRLIGQAVYYDRQRYRGSLIIAVAGPREETADPLLREVFDILASLGITCVYVAP